MKTNVDEIAQKADIIEVVGEFVQLQKKGRNFWGLCPFHDDINPSMSVSPEKQMFNCFSCGHVGGIFKFVQDIKKIPFLEAVKFVADKYGLDFQVREKKTHYKDNQKEIIKSLNDARDYFRLAIESEMGKVAHDYAEQRGLNSSIREKFNIGYAPASGTKEFLIEHQSNDESVLINASLVNDIGKDFFKERLMFAIENEHGDVVAFSGRTLKNEDAKYINSRETMVFNKSEILYNYKNALNEINRKKEVVIVEGFMDVIALHRAGIGNVVAIMGTALTEKHISKLRDKTVVLMFDGDKAGLNATIKSIKILIENKVAVKVVNNETNKDPDELLKESSEKLIDVFENRMTGFEFIYRLHQKQFKAEPEQIEQLINSLKKYMDYASDIERDFFAKRVATDYEVSKEIILKRWVQTLKQTSVPKEQQYIPNETYIPQESYEPQDPYAEQSSYAPSAQREFQTSVAQNRININWNNNAYKLIRSMLRNRNLAFYYEKMTRKPKFVNENISTLTAVVIGLHKGIKPSKDTLNYIKEEIKLEGEIAHNEAEFDVLIKLINSNYKIHIKNENAKKYLESTQEIKK